MHGFDTNIEKATLENTNFRKVLHTSEFQQLVVMSIPVGGEIGQEVHDENDQFIRIEAGQAEAKIDDRKITLGDDDVIIIPKGAEHNVVNTSSTQDLKLYTIYSPPHHKDGTVHATKDEADADDEHFDGKTSE
jgi:mannose-6-phosphate isomerase-like protein (cupin superfamily)